MRSIDVYQGSEPSLDRTFSVFLQHDFNCVQTTRVWRDKDIASTDPKMKKMEPYCDRQIRRFYSSPKTVTEVCILTFCPNSADWSGTEYPQYLMRMDVKKKKHPRPRFVIAFQLCTRSNFWKRIFVQNAAIRNGSSTLYLSNFWQTNLHGKRRDSEQLFSIVYSTKFWKTNHCASATIPNDFSSLYWK